MNSALIIFVKNPVLGGVKTNIARHLGNEVALDIYKKLLRHTKKITQCVSADLYVFYADDIVAIDLWNEPPYVKLVQKGNNLIERMHNAVEQLFKKGHRKVAIIGSDCIELENDILCEAFTRLDEHDVVIGPTIKGRYYLLAMKTFSPQLFNNKDWTSANLYNDTIAETEAHGLSVYKLPQLSDVATAEDCQKYPQLF